MGMFALLSFGGTIFILGRTVLMTTIDVETAQRLFLGMITSVLMAPISFFDTTPSSQIMSRIEREKKPLDKVLPEPLLDKVLPELLDVCNVVTLGLNTVKNPWRSSCSH
ncbi:hypothetical protein JHK86_010150 [Glycine max]|nr:hypothetical protein JHK86_010150 [Glycine max]